MVARGHENRARRQRPGRARAQCSSARPLFRRSDLSEGLNSRLARTFTRGRSTPMTDEKKKGDFDQWQRDDKGGNEKAHEHAENSRTSHKQTTGSGGRD